MCSSPFNPDEPTAATDEETLIYIGKHRPLSDYPKWARIIVRLAYWLTDYSDSQESAGIARSWDEAYELAAECPDGYFGMELPLGSLLPDEPCQLKPTVFFKTDAPDFYKNYRPKFLAIPASHFVEVNHRLAALETKQKRRAAST
jgi:hypothetical protein